MEVSSVGYQQKVAERIGTSGQRAEERTVLWQTLAKSFEQEGPDGVERHLRNLLDAAQETFDSTLAKLGEML